MVEAAGGCFCAWDFILRETEQCVTHAMLALDVLEVSGYLATSKRGKNRNSVEVPRLQMHSINFIRQGISPRLKGFKVAEEINYPSNSDSWPSATWEPTWIIINSSPPQ